MQVIEAQRRASSAVFDWASLIDSLGSEDFSPAVARELDRTARADHWSAFLLGKDAIQLVCSGSALDPVVARQKASLYADGGFWKSDPTIDRARNAISRHTTTAVRMSPDELPNASMRQLIYLDEQICDRVFVCGQRSDQWFGCSILRSCTRGRFEDDALGQIANVADALLTSVAKQHHFAAASKPPASLLNSIPQMEARLREMSPSLSKRETQVCARVLRGISTPGIAIELNLREDSIATYRKRAYRRLAIGTQHELMRMYLSLPVNRSGTASTRSHVEH